MPCRRDSLPRLVGERISAEIKARDRSRIGDSAPQYCGATKRSAERCRRRPDGVFQQPPKEATLNFLYAMEGALQDRHWNSFSPEEKEELKAAVEGESETEYLMSIPGMLKSIREGMATPLDECDEDLDW